MKASVVLILAGASVMAMVAGRAWTAPKPSDVPTSWELQFDYKDPRCIQVQIPGQKKPSTFWYFRYTVTNHTDGDQMFVPDITLYTDNGQTIRAGKGVPTSVFETVRKLFNNPLLKDQTAVSGTILRGEDNAKDSVALFTDIDPNAGSFDLFVGGLSGETATVPLPSPMPVTVTDKDGNRVTEMRDKAVLARTLQLHYILSGEASARGSNPPVLESKTWVMR